MAERQKNLAYFFKRIHDGGMPFRTTKRISLPLVVSHIGRNCQGQMAIFIALIFQVLFVLFAMTINVALIVHDKINLQNAVDLAVYYGAQKQAELLNVIAHENYAIRQSWKLLAWRYRVVGSAGVIDPQYVHPLRYNAPLPESPHTLINPSVCVTYRDNWSDVDSNESLCKTPQTAIPPLPTIKVVAGFLGFNIVFAALANRLRQKMANNCNDLGAYNWWFANIILQAFREDQRNRKQIIFGLAKNLSSGQNGDFVDLDGNSVATGVQKTLIKNLTFTNSSSLSEFKMFNSMEGIDPKRWLSEIKINPILLYVDPQLGDGCVAQPQVSSTPPQRDPQMLIASNPPPQGLGAADLIPWSTAGFLPDSEYQFSLGVEKNPWIMTYVGVSAETAPRQIFFPFGQAVTLKAQAFAKPFGGRIGPWYGSRWSRAAAQSSGTETDRLVPQRAGINGAMDDSTDLRRLPNYSRFPGDSLGLTSKLALSSLAGLSNLRTPYDVYKNIWIGMSPNGYNDPLAFDSFSPSVLPAIRNYEIAAVAPDLFDVTYYSIDPNFGMIYLPRLKANRARLGLTDVRVPIRGDLGQNGVINNFDFSVQDQMKVGAGLSNPNQNTGSLQRPEAFYFLRDRSHLLTAWTSGEFLYDYQNFPVDRFGNCRIPDEAYQRDFKVAGGCAARGGRTGYSVRLISKDYLMSQRHTIGGEQEGPGMILNPPRFN